MRARIGARRRNRFSVAARTLHGALAIPAVGSVPWHYPSIPARTLTGYAHPERLVTADWLSAHLGAPGLVIVESDEDVLLYDVGHIPGAVKIDWHTDLNDPHVRDYIDGEQFAAADGPQGHRPR